MGPTWSDQILTAARRKSADESQATTNEATTRSRMRGDPQVRQAKAILGARYATWLGCRKRGQHARQQFIERQSE